MMSPSGANPLLIFGFSSDDVQISEFFCKRWAEVIHSILNVLKLTPSKADPRKAPDLRCYEYIAIYVDDLCITAESPSAIIDIFKTK